MSKTSLRSTAVIYKLTNLLMKNGNKKPVLKKVLLKSKKVIKFVT